MSFWTSYVLVKEEQGISRDISLGKIETKYGITIRQEIEQELTGV